MEKSCGTIERYFTRTAAGPEGAVIYGQQHLTRSNLNIHSGLGETEFRSHDRTLGSGRWQTLTRRMSQSERHFPTPIFLLRLCKTIRISRTLPPKSDPLLRSGAWQKKATPNSDLGKAPCIITIHWCHNSPSFFASLNKNLTVNRQSERQNRDGEIR